MELEEYKFDHFKNIDEVMYYFNYWYKEEDVYSINRYLSLKDFNYISNKYQELQKENKKQKEAIDKAIELLGNYKHYSTPDEKQNGDNEDLVNNAFDTLKEVSE